jgi:putative ABC transport system permease protein
MWSAFARAWRAWTAARALAVLAITAFAVGIGSATAIYTVVNGVLLKPLPYRQGDRFYALYSASTSAANRRGAHPFPDLIEYEQRTRSFDVFGWLRPGNFTLIYRGQPQHITGAAVTPSLLTGVGVQPALGGWFADDGGVVISNALWRRLGSDAAIVGQPLTLDGRSYTITGVMPAAFRLPVPGPGVEQLRSDVWIRLDPKGVGQNRGEGLNFCYARLKPGVTAAQAEADVKRVAAELAALDPAGRQNYTAILDNLTQASIIGIRPTLILTAVGAALLLLLTCADVAGLLLARAVARARETAIRVALGAGRRQLALHYFLEAALVSLAGAVIGVALSALLVRVVLAIAADYIPRADEIALDGTVLVFAVGVAFATSALASLAPLWQAYRTSPADVLNEGVRSSASARTRRLSQSLVVAEIALAFTLLTISAILIAHLSRLGRTPPGFNPDNLLTFELARVQPGEMAPAARLAEQERFTKAIEQLPGVVAAGVTNQLPLAGCCFTTSLYPDGTPPDRAQAPRTSLLAISPQYPAAMQLPLRAGRLLDARDLGDDPVAVMVNETAARAYWAGDNPVGAFGRIGDPRGTRFQVVGVVGDVRNDGLGEPTVAEVYLSSGLLWINPMRFAVRSVQPAATLTPEIRHVIQGIDPAQPIHDSQTMRQIMEQSVSLPRISSLLTTFFALSALLMATLGIYGVVSYTVRQGTVELGTRMALGALDRELLATVLAGGVKMAAIGIAVGLAGAVAAAFLLVRVLDVGAIGPLPFLVSAGVIAIVTFAASFVPAWRVTALSPMVAMRNEPGAMWRSTRIGLIEALRGVSHAFTPSAAPPTFDEDLLTDFVAAARGADSYAQAFAVSLATLRNRIGASWAILLEHSAQEYRIVTRVPESNGETTALPDNGFLASRLRRYSYPLPLTPADLESWARWAGKARPAQVAELDALQALGARLVVGLRAKDEILGLLLLGPPLDRDRYSAHERAVLRQCGEQLTLMIENARLTSRVVEQEKVRRDLALAAEVQRRLLPAHPPERDTAVLSAFSVPARSVGGDFYDFIDLGNHRVGIALADIAGKGVAAALIMAVVQASLRMVVADGETSLPALAAKINEFLHRSALSKSYATFFYAQLDETSRQLRYVNAGHNPPYLVRPARDGAVEAEIRELNVGGTVLGLFPAMTYDEAVVDLQSGDVLIAFTDGVTEALNTAEEEFGEGRLKDVIRGTLHLPAAEISARLSDALRLWIKDTAQYDDLTFVVLKVN